MVSLKRRSLSTATAAAQMLLHTLSKSPCVIASDFKSQSSKTFLDGPGPGNVAAAAPADSDQKKEPVKLSEQPTPESDEPATTTKANDVHFFKPRRHDDVKYDVETKKDHYGKKFKEIFIDDQSFCKLTKDDFEKSNGDTWGIEQEFQMYCFQKFRRGEFLLNYGGEDVKTMTHLEMSKKLHDSDQSEETRAAAFQKVNVFQKDPDIYKNARLPFEEYCRARKFSHIREMIYRKEYWNYPLNKFYNNIMPANVIPTLDACNMAEQKFQDIFKDVNESSRQVCRNEVMEFRHPFKPFPMDSMDRFNFQRFCEAKFRVGDFKMGFGKSDFKNYDHRFVFEANKSLVKWCKDKYNQNPTPTSAMKFFLDFCDQAQERHNNGDFLLRDGSAGVLQYKTHRQIFQQLMEKQKEVVAYVEKVKQQVKELEQQKNPEIPFAEGSFMRFLNGAEERFTKGEFLLNYGYFYTTKTHKWIKENAQGYVQWCRECEIKCAEMKFFLKYVDSTTSPEACAAATSSQ